MFDYYTYAKAGAIFTASNQAARTLSGLSTTATGFILSNPWGSDKNLVLLKATFAFSTAPAGASVIGLAVSPVAVQTAVTHTSPITIRQSLLTGSSGQSIANADYAATTVGTPVWLRPLGGPVAASQINPPFISDNIEGSLILPPGTSMQFAYLTTAAVGLASMIWAELPA